LVNRRTRAATLGEIRSSDQFLEFVERRSQGQSGEGRAGRVDRASEPAVALHPGSLVDPEEGQLGVVHWLVMTNRYEVIKFDASDEEALIAERMNTLAAAEFEIAGTISLGDIGFMVMRGNAIAP